MRSFLPKRSKLMSNLMVRATASNRGQAVLREVRKHCKACSASHLAVGMHLSRAKFKYPILNPAQMSFLPAYRTLNTCTEDSR